MINRFQISILKITGLFLLLLCTFYCQAQEEFYSFLRLNTTDGLVNNQTTAIFKDSRGFLWFGTSSGLSRFDGTGFRNFTHNSKDSTSLFDNYIVNIQEDNDGNLWIETRWDYTIYDFNKEKFIQLPEQLKEFGISEPIDRVYIDKEKNIWFKTDNDNYYLKYNTAARKLEKTFAITGNEHSTLVDFYHDGINYYNLYSSGSIECFNGNTNKLVFQDNFLLNNLGSDSLNARIYVDHGGDLWVYGNNDGINNYQAIEKKWVHFTTNSEPLTLTSNLIKKVVEDQNGKIWIGTDHGGVDIYDKQNKSIQKLYHQTENHKSISQNSITDIIVDSEGIVWIGTYKNGISYYHKGIHKFQHFRHMSTNKNSLPFNDVNCFVEDGKGNLWIGTNGGGLIYFDRNSNTYTSFKNDSKNKNSISNDVIVSLFIDDSGILWIGTFTGGLNTFDGKNFTRYYAGKGNNSLSNNNIWSISQDKEKRIWIGTLGGGIVLFDKKDDKFFPVPTNGEANLPSPFITKIQSMRSGKMFIGTALGIIFYDPESKRYLTSLFEDTNKTVQISNNNVNDVYEDSRGLLWVATREGLTVIDPFTNYVKQFNNDDGLPEDIMNCIQEDNQQAIWVSKSTGLSKIQLKREGEQYHFQILNFAEEDGLQGKEFNVNASTKTRDGELIFGGPNGFNLFHPAKIEFNTNNSDIVFTDFQIFNEPITVGEAVDKKTILQNSITSTSEIELKESMNVFSIEFAALNFFTSDKIRYQYKLEGFDREWIDADSPVRKVTYTNLNAGNYIFKVKSTNNDGFWNEEYKELVINILPPFYKTPLAYMLYAVIIAAMLLYYRHIMLNRQRVKFELEQERVQARKHLELDEMKLRFLTNVSHEFRTPLTLIMTPLERLKTTIREPGESKMLGMIERNANQLLALVNQLLDFRKLDLQGLQFNPSYGDLIIFIQEVCEVFQDSFNKKGVKLVFAPEIKSIQFLFDHEKIQKVIMNLLSNALKFTPAGGKVVIEIGELDNEQIRISVTDSGIGILEDEREKIFERFYQSKNSQSMGLTGSGIGLNLAREMIQLHDGTLKVENAHEGGSAFIISLPVINKVERIESEVEIPDITIEEEESILQAANDIKEQSILLVEDNLDFRIFMRETLEEKYEILEAASGTDGYEIALKNQPDLIISDVMMPGMDGLELCQKLKNDVRTSHVPIIMLTARTADEDKIKGLEIGADDYITKPFKMDLLLLRIQNLMEKRLRLQEHFKKKIEINPSEIEISSIDEKLIKKAIELVELNIDEPKFSVEDLSHELGMSRVHLYKKLRAITGKSPLEFIRIIRLKRGAQLLEKSQANVSEVAYAVGFNSPRYFSKYFEEQFGMLPSSYLKNYKKRQEQN